MPSEKFKETEIGFIPKDWEIKTVKQLIDENILEKPIDGNHGNIHPKGDDFVSSGIPFIMASDLKEGKVNIVNCSFIRKSQADNLQKGFSKEGDVLLSHKATIGRTAIVEGLKSDYIILTPQVTYYRIKNPKKLNNIFLKYYFNFKNFKQLFTSWAESSGSTRAYLGIKGQQQLPILFPPIEEQKTIVNNLTFLDDKIELNNQMNQTLEKIGQSIFKHWFVDFEFPDENGNPYKSSGGEMIDSELGDVPSGWEVQELNEFIKFVKGKKPKELFKTFENGLLPQILIETLDGKQSSFTNPKKMVITNVYDPIMVMDGASSGRIEIGQNGVLGSTLSKITLNNNVLSEFYVYWFLKLREKDINENTTGTSIPHTDKNKIKKYLVPIPSKNLLNNFDNLSKKIIDLIILNRDETTNLSKIRDSLLPKLMSGKIRVNIPEEATAK